MSIAPLAGVSLVDHVGDTIIIEVDYMTDMTDTSAVMQWRVRPEGPVDALPTVDKSRAAAGLVAFTLDAAASRELGAGVWLFDVETVTNGIVETWPWGSIRLAPDITRRT